MRKTLIGIGIFIVLVVVAVAALPFLVDANRYRPRIQSELQARTGRPVSLGKMDLSVFPLAFRVENAVIGEDSAYPSKLPFAHVGELYVSAKLIPLLKGDVQVDSLELHRPRIELIRNAQGVWNFATLGGETPSKGQAPSVPGQVQTPSAESHSPAAREQKFTFSDVKVVDGQVGVTDYQKKQPRAVYDHVDLNVKNFAKDRRFPIELAAHLPGNGKQLLSLDGEAGPLRPGNLAATDFKGNLKLEEVSLAGIKKFLNSQALSDVDFVASGDAQIENKGGAIASQGKLELKNGRVNGVEIGYPIAADYNVTADLNNDVVKIEKGTLKLGSTPLSVTGTMNTGATPMLIDLKLKAGNASIAEAARLAAAFDIAFHPGMDIKGRIDADLTARGAANKPVMNGTVTSRELVITGQDLPQAIQVTKVDLALSPTAIKSNDFIATTGSTAAHVTFLLNNYASDASTIDASLRADGAQLGELLNIAKAGGITAVRDVSGSGPVSLNVRVQGSTKKNAALSYSGSGTLRNATFSMPALTKPVNLQQADLRFTQNTALLENVVLSVGGTSARGNMQLRGLSPGATPTVQFALAADKVDASEWQQLMRNQPVKAKAAFSFDLVPEAYAQSRAAEPPLMHRLVGNGTLNVGTIVYDKLVLNNAQSNVSLDHGVIKLSPFTAQAYGGAVNGNILMDTRPTPAVYTINTKLDRVDANQLLSAVSKADKILFGLLAANANTNFSGTTSENVVSNMNGNINLNITDGKIANLDLLNQLSNIGQFGQTGRTSQPYTNVVKMTGNFDVKNGVARTDNLNAVIDAGTLAAKGNVDLGRQTLDLQVTAVLSKDFTQSVGGTSIGGFLNTALANAKGELVMPVLVTGTFTNPKVSPDMKRVAQMKLDNLLPSMSSPGSLTTGILGGLLGTKPKEELPQTDQNGDQQNTSPKNVGGQNPDGSAAPAKQAEPAKPASIFDQIMGAVGAQQKKKTEPQKAPEKTEPPPPEPPK